MKKYLDYKSKVIAPKNEKGDGTKTNDSVNPEESKNKLESSILNVGNFMKNLIDEKKPQKEPILSFGKSEKDARNTEENKNASKQHEKVEKAKKPLEKVEILPKPLSMLEQLSKNLTSGLTASKKPPVIIQNVPPKTPQRVDLPKKSVATATQETPVSSTKTKGGPFQNLTSAKVPLASVSNNE